MRYLKIIAAGMALCASAPALAASIFEQISPNPTAYGVTIDYNTASFGATQTDVTASIFRLTGSDGAFGLSLGCSAGDFGGGVSGNIVLLSRGTCEFVVKTKLAQDAGAVAVLIAENNPANLGAAGLGGFDPLINIAAFRVSYDLGGLLAQQTLTGSTTVRMALGDNLVSNLPAVPEPATWALFLGGFGLVGATMRGRKAASSLT